MKYSGIEVQQRPGMADLKCEEQDHSNWQTWCGMVMIEHAFREPPVKTTIPVDSIQLDKASVDFLVCSEFRSRMRKLKTKTIDEENSHGPKKNKRREQ